MSLTSGKIIVDTPAAGQSSGPAGKGPRLTQHACGLKAERGRTPPDIRCWARSKTRPPTYLGPLFRIYMINSTNTSRPSWLHHHAYVRLGTLRVAGDECQLSHKEIRLTFWLIGIVYVALRKAASVLVLLSSFPMSVIRSHCTTIRIVREA